MRRTPAAHDRRKRAFTLVELLVVIAIIALLLAMLIPSVSSVRESARRTECQNNLKQLGIACQSYESTSGTLPPGTSPGAIVPAPAITFGVSWLVELLPRIEASALYDKLDLVGAAGHPIGIWHGSTNGHIENARVAKGHRVPTYRCPSSSLPEFAWTTVTPEPAPIGIWRPAYTGIAGSSDHGTVVYYDGTGPASAPVGWSSSGGLIIRKAPVAIARARDGLSNTLMIGEQSGWLRNSASTPVDGRSDHGHGFSMGSNRDSANTRDWNITTIAYQINENRWELFGVGFPANWGVNRPIQSAHPGGSNVVLGDGSVRFLDERLELQTLKRLADKDDGQILGDF